MSAPIHWATVAAYGIGLLLTLALAGLLTPRRWWRRPTAGNLAMVGGGTLAFGFLLASLLPAAAPAVASPQEQPLTPPLSLVTRMPAAAPPRYRVIDSLNLRAAKATGAPRLAVLPAGTLVTPLGGPEGDWLRVRARLKGKELEGWTSSLWLRRVDERTVGADN